MHLFNQMVQAQQARNVKVLALIRVMEDLYSVAVSANDLRSHSVLHDTIAAILKQTIECGYFIEHYTQRSFGGT